MVKKGAELKLPDAVCIGPCPCGADVLASASQGVVIHTLPLCEVFSDLAALPYLEWLRASKLKERA